MVTSNKKLQQISNKNNLSRQLAKERIRIEIHAEKKIQEFIENVDRIKRSILKKYAKI